MTRGFISVWVADVELICNTQAWSAILRGNEVDWN